MTVFKVSILCVTGHGVDEACITQATSLCKRVVSSFSYNWRNRRELAEVQMQLGLPSHQLITESATRWGSRLQMIKRVLEQERVLAKSCLPTKKQTFCPYLAEQSIWSQSRKLWNPLRTSLTLFQEWSMWLSHTWDLCFSYLTLVSCDFMLLLFVDVFKWTTGRLTTTLWKLKRIPIKNKQYVTIYRNLSKVPEITE